MSLELRDQLQAALGSTYTLERELGGGGMSRVFLAVETALGRKVVIKVLAPELAAGVSAERFAREIRLAAKLQHPNIVPLHAAGDAGGLPYYTMPFVEGLSLRSRMTSGGLLPVPECIRILRDVARAIAYAHDQGIVHRDIKPENILLSGDAAVVTDFGIAKAVSVAQTLGSNETLTSAGVGLGTPAYMAPEQASGDPSTDYRADFYSFGCLAYELLTGQPPFTGRPVHQLLIAHAMRDAQATGIGEAGGAGSTGRTRNAMHRKKPGGAAAVCARNRRATRISRDIPRIEEFTCPYTRRHATFHRRDRCSTRARDRSSRISRSRWDDRAKWLRPHRVSGSPSVRECRR